MKLECGALAITYIPQKHHWYPVVGCQIAMQYNVTADVAVSCIHGFYIIDLLKLRFNSRPIEIHDNYNIVVT